MSEATIRLRIENDLFERHGKRYSEEEQANHLANLVREAYGLLSVAVLALDPSGKAVSVFAHRGLSGNFIKQMYARPLSPLIGAALEAEVVAGEGTARGAEAGFRLEHAASSVFAAPCRVLGETYGVFVADSAKVSAFDPQIREEFRAYAALSAFYLALRALKGRISRVPDVDAVTGLSTFKSFHEVLHREITRGRKFGHPVALVFVKVRHLREMNEVYGHVAADEALAEAARRIRAELREVDYAARSGGTVYVVMPQMDKEEAAETARRIARAVDAAPIGRGEVRLALAMGVAAYPRDGENERILIPHVEAMVHESVRRGGNAVSVFRD